MQNLLQRGQYIQRTTKGEKDTSICYEPGINDVVNLIRQYIEIHHADLINEDGYLVIELPDGDDHIRVIITSSEKTGKSIKLSPREQEIARLIASGHPDKYIAYTLKISRNTVKTYIRRIFSKLNVNSRTQMIACMMKQGLMQHL